MGTAGEQIEIAASVLGVGGFAERPAVDDDVGVAGDDDSLRVDRAGLAAGVLDDLLVGVAAGQLIDPGNDDLKGDAELLEDLPPLRRAGCQRDRQESSGNQIPISRSADSSESDP